jgi:hypothetical protein
LGSAEAGRRLDLAEGNLSFKMPISRGTVADIQSTELQKGELDQPFADAALHPVYGLIDFVPVEVDQRIIGVAIKPDRLDTILSKCMVQLTEDMLISSSTCLLNLVHADWKKSTFFLVVDDTKICGIVTKADLNKLPVRVRVFEQIAAYEQLLTYRLEHRLGRDESWLTDLNQHQARTIRSQFNQDLEAGLELSLISCASLGSKVDVAFIRLQEIEKFKKQDVRRITSLRNAISHGKPMITPTFTVNQLSADLKLIDELCLALTS